PTAPPPTTNGSAARNSRKNARAARRCAPICARCARSSMRWRASNRPSTAKHARSPSTGNRRTTTMAKGRAILLVDDDPGLLRLLSLRLESSGYAVRTAPGGKAALAEIEMARPDLVITDLRMEPMDGLELLDAMARVAPGLPVILITAHGNIPDAVRATQSGAF